MKNTSVKLKLSDLQQALHVFRQAQGRGTFPVNYMIDRNVDKMTEALKPLGNRLKEEPYVWFLTPKEELTDKEKEDGVEITTDEQKAEGEKALLEAVSEEINFKPWRISVDKMCDSLRAFPKGRETLDEEELENLNVNFWVGLRMLEIIEE